MKNNTKVLLTGATGFLGSKLLMSLIEHSYEVFVLKRLHSNLQRIESIGGQVSQFYNCEEDGINRVFKEQSIDVVIHCATNYGRKESKASQVVESNLLFPIRILETGIARGLKVFINTDTLLGKNVSEYALSKKQFSEWLQNSSRHLSCIDVALEHFYGAGDESGKFVSWLLDNFLNGAKNLDLTLGEQKRDFIYVDDVVSAFLLILKNSKDSRVDYQRFEVGSGQSTSVRDLVQTLSELCQPHSTHLNFGAISYRENEQMDCKVDLRQIQKLGWKPTLSLKDGLSQMLAQELRLRNL